MRRGRAVWIAGAFLAASLVIGVLAGAEPTSLLVALRDPESLDRLLIVDVRGPRVLLAALAGAGLSVVGAAYQSLLRNPLAEPYVLGVSGGAAVGATAIIAIGVGPTTFAGAAALPVAAFAGGLGATLLVYGVARSRRDPGGATLLLAGVMVNALAAAIVTFIKTLVPPYKATQLLRWLTGFVELPTVEALGATALWVGLGGAALLYDAGRLNLLALGEEGALAVGVDTRALERRVFLAASAVVGGVVSVTGLIGFIGLVVPHVLRRRVGPDARLLLPLSMLGGAGALALCDTAARVSFRILGSEPPVGAITALVGGPLFLVLLRRGRDPHDAS